MKVCYICGYYSDLAHNKLARRTEDYWDAYFYVWAVKFGAFKRRFFIHSANGKIEVTQNNFKIVRQMFGGYIADRIVNEGMGNDPLLIPIPSKDGVIGNDGFRTFNMLTESMAGTQFSQSAYGGLHWTHQLPKAHEGGTRRRETLKQFLHVDPAVAGRDVILIDDLLSTGGSLLAAKDRLQEVGANVLGAVTCGRTIYDFQTKPFGRQDFWLEEEVADFGKIAAVAGR